MWWSVTTATHQCTDQFTGTYPGERALEYSINICLKQTKSAICDLYNMPPVQMIQFLFKRVRIQTWVLSWEPILPKKPKPNQNSRKPPTKPNCFLLSVHKQRGNLHADVLRSENSSKQRIVRRASRGESQRQNPASCPVHKRETLWNHMIFDAEVLENFTQYALSVVLHRIWTATEPAPGELPLTLREANQHRIGPNNCLLNCLTVTWTIHLNVFRHWYSCGFSFTLKPSQKLHSLAD